MAPVSRVAGLVAPAAVSPLTPGSVWDTTNSTKLGATTSKGFLRRIE